MPASALGAVAYTSVISRTPPPDAPRGLGPEYIPTNRMGELANRLAFTRDYDLTDA